MESLRDKCFGCYSNAIIKSEFMFKTEKIGFNGKNWTKKKNNKIVIHFTQQ